jgi:DNA-directed RNA polymerase specialized sigma24 family protein
MSEISEDISPEEAKAQITECIPQLRAFAALMCCGDGARGDELALQAVEAAFTRRADRGETPWLNFMLRRFHDQFRLWRIKDGPQEFTCWSDAPKDVKYCRALAKLADDQREALLLVAIAGPRRTQLFMRIAGLGYEVGAEITGVGMGTFKSRSARGRRELILLTASEEERALIES